MLKFKKTISIIIISGLILSYSAYLTAPPAYAFDGGGGYASAAAGWAHFAKYVLKEFILDLAARLTARLQLTSGLNSIAKQLIQSGRTGRTPAFVQNWRNFITDSQYRGEDVFRSILATTENCPHIRNDMLGLFGVKLTSPITQNTRTNNLNPYQMRGKCTLPAGWSIKNYDQDFAGNGGWDALTRLTQPQNNFYGATILAITELENQRNLDSNADRAEAGANGFTGTRMSSKTGSSCDTPPKGQCTTAGGSIGSGIACSTDSECLSKGYTACTGGGPSQARCTFLGNITTPSKILGDAGAEFIDSNLKWLVSSDEISEILGNFISTMLGRLANFTADSIAPDKVAEPEKTQYEACVKKCQAGSRSQLATCTDACYKGSGVDSPPDYGSSTLTGSPTPAPAPTPIPVPTPTPAPTPIPLPPGATSLTASLQTINGQYVGAQDGGGSTVIATAASIGIWETFLIYDLNGGTLNSGDQVAVTTYAYRAFRAEGGGGSTLDATASDVGIWETFVINNVAGGAVTNGSQVSFQTWDGIHYIFADGGGGGLLGADRTSVGAWETFTITLP